MNQRGNALFLILIAVILFAALAYAVSKSNNGNAGQVSEEKLSIEFSKQQQILTGTASALQRLMASGCDAATSNLLPAPDSFISLGYTPAPNCTLYTANGGSISPTRGGPVVFADGNGLETFLGSYAPDAMSIPGVGGDGPDSVVYYLFGWDELEAGTAFAATSALHLCNYINQKYNVTGYTPAATDDIFMSGALVAGGGLNDNPNPLTTGNASFDGKAGGCFFSTSLGSFVHYIVAIER